MAAASPPTRWSASAPSCRATSMPRRDAAACCSMRRRRRALPVVKPLAPPVASGQASDDPQRNFRFFDNRQKYLLFVNTCSEKWEIANRVGLELANIHPRPPAVRVFDAGVGDGTVLARVMRSMHDRFPDHAVLHRRQGNQPGGHPAHAAQDGGPLHRASRPPCWCSPISPMPKRPGWR